MTQLHSRLQPNKILDGYFCPNKSDGRRTKETTEVKRRRNQFRESLTLITERNGRWKMVENQKQLSLLLSVLVQTELHSVWQSFPNSHNTRDFRTTIIKQIVNYNYNTYPPKRHWIYQCCLPQPENPAAQLPAQPKQTVNKRMSKK